MYDKAIRGPLVLGNKNIGQITSEVLSPMERKLPVWWYIALTISLSALTFGAWAAYRTIAFGIGEWGVNNTVGWGWGIINFVWWIGIGHAGTAFSIFLLVLRQKWRTSINRSAEAMTVFAILCASMYPLLHLGRIWLFFYIMPYPNFRGPLWINFNSPLFWDVVAISTYVFASATFWYVGMLPDFAIIRERAGSKIKKFIYSILSFGWNGSAKTWFHFENLSLVLAGITAALVVSVHSIVAMDFATAVEPGWHTTIFPPYFVVGAIFSGFAMVLTLVIIMRHVFNLKDFITDSHINAITKILIFISLIMATGYATEIFISWYSGNQYEMFTFFHNRINGDYRWAYWIMVTCNAFIPQLFWFKKVRSNIAIVFVIALLINLGMWFERFVIVVTSLTKDFMPANWHSYHPTIVEIGIFIGTLGFFVTGILIFFRFFPVIAIHEIKGVNNIGEESNH